MKTKRSQWFEIFVVSINYIVISYALSNMAFIFKSSPLFMLFFASELWITESYWKNVRGRTKNKVIAAILLVSCFVIHISVIYFIGYVSGTVIAFNR